MKRTKRNEFLMQHSFIQRNFRDAAMMSMRRKITGRSPSEIKQIRREEVDLPVTEQDFHDAMIRTRKSVSANDVARFEKWMEEYGSC